MNLTLPESLLEQARALADPVLFAQRFLGIEVRDYQAEFLRHKARSILLRWGRRAGKSFSCALLAVWYAFTHERVRVVVVYPVEDQVHAFFRDHVRDNIISRAPDLFGPAIVQNSRDPETIAFANGSTILGFTAGTRASGQAMSVRGQGADLLILDEMHYMDDEDVNALLPLVADRPQARVIAASTCRVSAGKFYEFYRNAHDPDPSQRFWVDLHVPTWRVPSWEGEKSERYWKMLLGEEGYLREIAAEFPDADTTTVFPPPMVRRAIRDYSYITTPVREALRAIGVDWDVAQATPTLCMVEWDPEEVNDSGERGMVRVILREEIPRSQFTLDSAVQRIIALNGLFRPIAIYVDRGFGEYQVEILHKMGRGATSPADPAWGLDRIVRGISFSQTLEVPDPVTGEVERKPIKPFMINQLSLLLQRDRLRLSSQDQRLIDQMMNFRIKTFGATGRPIYTDTNEHGIDALALAVMALVDQVPEVLPVLTPAGPPAKPVTTTGLIPKAIPLETSARPGVSRSEPSSEDANLGIRVNPPQTDPTKPHFVGRARRGSTAYASASLWPRGAGRIRIRRQAAF